MTGDQRYSLQTIQQRIKTKWAGSTVHFAEETDSTNLWLRRLAQEGVPHGTLCVADYQSAGKGSRARTWTAEAGTSVMMSLLLRPSFSPACASMLTLVMGLSIAESVRDLGLDAGIKWPNDVVVSGKKICGILTEMETEQGSGSRQSTKVGSSSAPWQELSGDVSPPSAPVQRQNGEADSVLTEIRIREVIIGAGINVNIRAFPAELADKATSLLAEGGHPYDRAQLIGSVLDRFEKNYEVFTATCDLSSLKTAYEALLLNRQAPVRILDERNPAEGIALGIDETGRLLVQCPDQLRKIRSGEVSIRGLYSYV